MATKGFYPFRSGLAIIAGPSKFDLMNSLFKKGEKIEFKVKCDNGHEISFPFTTQGITCEDGSHERWLIKGYTFNSNDNSFDSACELYFDSRSRTGSIIEYTNVG